jgi:stage V sporulation protein B
MPRGVDYASAGAIGGVSIGGGMALLFLVSAFLFYARRPREEGEAMPVASRKTILKRLVSLALPITLGASVFSLSTVIDTAMVSNILKGLNYGEQLREQLFGYLSRATTMFNLPPTVIAAIAVSIVPAIATLKARNETEQLKRQIYVALRITLLFALPCAIGLSVLAEPILTLIYNDGNHAELLTVLGLAVASVTFVQVSNAVLQALGKIWLPVRNMALGGLLKIVINILLVSNPKINISGATVGTFCCYLLIVLLNLWDIKRAAGIRFGVFGFFLKPLLASLLMGGIALLVYTLTAGLGTTLSVALAILSGGIAYVILLFACRIVTEEELLLLPKGEKMTALCTKIELI